MNRLHRFLSWATTPFRWLNGDQWLTLTGIVVNVCLAITTIYLARYARQQWLEVKAQTPAVEAAAQVAMLGLQPEITIDELKADGVGWIWKPYKGVEFDTKLIIENVGQRPAQEVSIYNRIKEPTGEDPRQEIKDACSGADKKEGPLYLGGSETMQKGQKTVRNVADIVQIARPDRVLRKVSGGQERRSRGRNG